MTAPTATLLMTRPRPASDRFVAGLPPGLRQRLALCHSPLIEIVPRESRIAFGAARGLVFTSANGVAAAEATTDRRDLPCYCVGAATTRAAASAGWRATCCGGTADELVARLARDRPLGPLLHLRGAHTRGDVAARLTAAGCVTEAQVVYDQVLQALSAEARAILDHGAPVIAPLFSPRTARQFADQAHGTALLFVPALSQAVTEPLRGLRNACISVADRPDAAAMAALIEKLVNRICRVEGGGTAQ